MVAIGNELYFRTICQKSLSDHKDRKLKDILSALCLRSHKLNKFSGIFEGLLFIFFFFFIGVFRLLMPDCWMEATTTLLFSFLNAYLFKGIISVSTVYPSPFFKSCQTLIEFSRHNLFFKTVKIFIGPFYRKHSPVSSPMSIDAALATLLLLNFVSYGKTSQRYGVALIAFAALWWGFLLLGFIVVNICYTSEVIIAVLISWLCQVIVTFSVMKSMQAKKENRATWFTEFLLESCKSKQEIEQEMSNDSQV